MGEMSDVCNIFAGKQERSETQTEGNIQKTLKIWVGRWRTESRFLRIETSVGHV
jgi:hypothetical protein